MARFSRKFLRKGDRIGKTLAARMINRYSKRSREPIIKVDIAAIPETLLESELFGYKKGAFTGANTDKKGFFEAAHGGTLFLDELENLPAYAQSKILGVVEDRAVVPIQEKNLPGTKNSPFKFLLFF